MSIDFDWWKQSEGQNVDSVYPLERLIGGSADSAVFETRFENRPAAIKLIPGTPESIAALLTFWEKAAALSHSALVPIFAHGEMTLGDARYAYLVMERAEENLAEVLSGRFLTPVETRDMLLPVLGALEYLDAKGFAHGRLKPANIMAFGEQVKISSDRLVAGGDAAADCRAVGVLIEEVLGDRNTNLPKPFAEIAKNSLAPDPAVRWNRAQIEAALSGDPKPAARSIPRAAWWSFAAVAAFAILFLVWRSQNQTESSSAAAPNPLAAVSTTAAPAVVAVPTEAKLPQAKQLEEAKQPEVTPSTPAEPKKDRAGKDKVKSSPNAAANVAPEPAPTQEDSGARDAIAGTDGITRVMPNIPQAALNTITGRVRINVRVHIESDGSVRQVTLQPPAASKYFTDRVLAAAQAWKFPAASAPQNWDLHFELIRREVRASAAKVSN